MSKTNEKNRFLPIIYVLFFIAGLIIGLSNQNQNIETKEIFSPAPKIIYSLNEIDNRIDLTIQSMKPPYLISIGLTFDEIVTIETNYSIFFFLAEQLLAPHYFAVEYNDIGQTLVYYQWYNVIWDKNIKATIDLNFDIQPVAVWIQIDDYTQPLDPLITTNY